MRTGGRSVTASNTFFQAYSQSSALRRDLSSRTRGIPLFSVPTGQRCLQKYGAAQNVDREHGKRSYKDQKNHVLQLPQRFIPPKGFLLFRKQDFVQQILNQPERTQPTADKPANQSANEYEKSGCIVGEFKTPASDDGLKRAKGGRSLWRRGRSSGLCLEHTAF